MSALPAWRRSPARRSALLLLCLLPALLLQSLWLDPQLPLHTLQIAAFALPCSAVLNLWPRIEYSPARLLDALLEALILSALLAACWPAGTSPAIGSMTVPAALLIAHVLGGVAANPFPPLLLALGLGATWLDLKSQAFPMSPVPVPDALASSAVWLAVALLPILLGQHRLLPMLAFLLPLLIVCLGADVAASQFVPIAILAGFVLAAPRHLPVTRTGSVLLAALIGLSCALALLHGAAPTILIWLPLAGFGLSPWIENLSLSRPEPAP